jgi:multiple sugar transport system substrate-binding protein
LLAAQCGGGASTTAAPKALAPAKLFFMGRGQATYQQAFEDLSTRFTQQFPNVAVQYTHEASNPDQKYQVLAASDQTPDVYFGTAAFYKAHLASGIATAVDDLAKRDRQFKEADYDAYWLVTLRYKVKLGGMPWDPGMWVLFYNRNLFQRAGLKFPDAATPLNWEDVVDMARRLTLMDGSDVTQWGLDLNWNRIWWHLPRQMGLTDFYQGDENVLKLDNPVALGTLQWMADLVVKQKVARTPGAVAFETGKLAMGIGGIWTAGTVRSKLQDDWDWAPFPQFRGKKRVAMGQASPLIMGTSSKSKDAAWELMKFLGGPIGQERAMTIGISQPILKAQHNSPIFSGQKPPHTPQVALDDVQYAIPSPYGPSYNDIQALFDKTMAPVYAGQQSAQQAFTAALPEFQRILSESKQRFG